MSEKRKKNHKYIVETISLILIVGIILIIVWFLTSKKESYTTTQSKANDYESLECSSSSPNSPFFTSKTAQRFTHSIKIMFTDKKVKEMSYRYDGTFNSDDAAESAKAAMHADYNKYMSANGVYQETLNPVFSSHKSKLVISLYAETKKINQTVAKLFFINDDEYKKTGDFTLEDFKKFYELKGFSCKNHD